MLDEFRFAPVLTTALRRVEALRAQAIPLAVYEGDNNGYDILISIRRLSARGAVAEPGAGSIADAPHPRVSQKYLFISTSAVINALMSEGFVPVNARQTNARQDRAGFARHMIRFRHPREALSLREAVPELVLINAHDGTSYYQLRAGLYRPLCTNGLIARLGDFGVIHVPHRGNIIANVVEGAHQIMRGFENVGEAIERMAVTLLTEEQRIAFAEAALRIRYREGEYVPYAAGRLLEARREVDRGEDVWHVYNVIQENLMRGGITGTSQKGRATRTRGIRAIQEDVRINRVVGSRCTAAGRLTRMGGAFGSLPFFLLRLGKRWQQLCGVRAIRGGGLPALGSVARRTRRQGLRA